MPDSAESGGREADARTARGRRSRWLDRALGIVLGIALGIAVIIAFVFYGSEQTIDAPRISGGHIRQSQGGHAGRSRVPLVPVVNGAPPPRGPVRLDFKQGKRAVFVVDSNAPVTVAVPGYGIQRALGRGRSTVAFTAPKSGQYPLVVVPSNIDIAVLRVSRP